MCKQKQCWQPQVHLLSVELSSRLHDGCPHNCQDRLGWLPDDMSSYILSYLDPGITCHVTFLCFRLVITFVSKFSKLIHTMAKTGSKLLAQLAEFII